MATVGPQHVHAGGVIPDVHNASVGGDKIPPDAIMRVSNASGAPINVTLVTPQTVDGDLTVQDRIVPVANGAPQYLRASQVYRNPVDGLVDVQWSDATNVTFELVQ